MIISDTLTKSLYRRLQFLEMRAIIWWLCCLIFPHIYSLPLFTKKTSLLWRKHERWEIIHWHLNVFVIPKNAFTFVVESNTFFHSLKTPWRSALNDFAVLNLSFNLLFVALARNVGGWGFLAHPVFRHPPRYHLAMAAEQKQSALRLLSSSRCWWRCRWRHSDGQFHDWRWVPWLKRTLCFFANSSFRARSSVVCVFTFYM